jgi:hypothetical protein
MESNIGINSGDRMIVSEKDDEFFNAAHEAGHAVAWSVLKLGLVAVTVDPTQIAKFPETACIGFNTSGLTISLPVSALTSEQKTTIGLCGMLAEIKARTGQTRLTDFDGVEEVLSRAQDDLQEIYETGVDSGEAADVAINLVERLWEAIEAVAIRLRIDKTLDADTVATIVEICR